MTRSKRPTTYTLNGEWTTIEMNGLKYTVWCMPPEPEEPEWNDLEVYIGITENMKSRLLTKEKIEHYSQRAIQEWLDKFPKPLTSNK